MRNAVPKGKLEYSGSLLELRVTLESNPRGLDALADWPAIRHYGRELWGQPAFDAKPLELLSDWLVAEHGKDRDCPVEYTPRGEVAALLRAAVEANRRNEERPPAVKPEQGEGNGGAGSTPKKARSTKTPRRGRPVDTDPKADKRVYEAWKTGRYNTQADCARELGMEEKQAKDAIERHRKRLERKGKYAPDKIDR